MLHRHFDDYVHHSHGRRTNFGRGPFRGWRSRGGGFGGREGRMFDGGELRLVILALVAEKAPYGYEVIKELGERVGGDYSPSPGVVLSTLETMLEEMGYGHRQPGPAGAQALCDHPRGREGPQRQQSSDRRHLRPLRRSRREPVRRVHLGQAGDAQSPLPPFSFACAAAPPALSRSRRSSTPSTRRPRRSSASGQSLRRRGMGMAPDCGSPAPAPISGA